MSDLSNPLELNDAGPFLLMIPTLLKTATSLFVSYVLVRVYLRLPLDQIQVRRLCLESDRSGVPAYHILRLSLLAYA